MRLQSSAVLIALTAIGLATALVVVAWQFGATDEPEDIPGLPPAAEQSTKQKTAAQKASQRSRPTARATRVNLVAVAAQGDCWLEIHRGSAAGELLYDGTLESGRRTAQFTGRQLWVNIGAPSNVVIRVNGRRAQLPGSGAPRTVLVTRKGVTLART